MFARAVPVPVLDVQHGFSLVVRAAGNDTVSCGFEGNSDFYGLGIRLGIYFQWVTTLLAHLFFDEAIPGNLELNCVFLIAVSAATLVATRTGTIRPAECLVLLHLCFGFIFSILSIWGHRIDMKFSLAGSSFRLALATAISSYAVWFWFRGLELLALDACPIFTFIVVPKAVSHAIGTFYKAQSSIVLAVYSFLLAREMLITFCFFAFCAMISGVFAEIHVKVVQMVRPSSDSRGHHLYRVLKMWVVMTMTVFWAYFNGQKSTGVYRPSLFAYILPVVDVTIFVLWSAWQLLFLLVVGRSPPPGFTYPPLLSLRRLRKRPQQPAEPEKMPAVFERIRKLMVSTKVLFLVNISCLAWAVIAIEVTLHWNSVNGIYDIATTGQLIPFIIGVISILRLFLALTVHSTTQHVTNILLRLFDRKTHAHSDEDEPGEETQVLNGDFACPISPRHEAVFWNRIRTRRHSMETDLKLSENRPDKLEKTHLQIFPYNRLRAEYYSCSEQSSDDDDDSTASYETNKIEYGPGSSWMRGLRHGLGDSRQELWEFDNAELDKRTVITLVGHKTGSTFPDTMKCIWVKPAWEDDLDLQVRPGITSVRRGAVPELGVRQTDPSQQPANHLDRIATGPADFGSLGPDNLADLPPGRIHSYFFTSDSSLVPFWLSSSASSDRDSGGGQKTGSRTKPSRRFASLCVLINLFFIVLSWIFTEQRILWAFEQYGRILGLSMLGRLWHRFKISFGLHKNKETQTQARPLESAGGEARQSQEQPQEDPRKRGDWGPHRKRLGKTACEEMEKSNNQAPYSLQDHLGSLYGILKLHLQARGFTYSSVAVRSIMRLVNDFSHTRQEFVDGDIGLEQQHVKARTQWYDFRRRLNSVEWMKIAEVEMQKVFDEVGDNLARQIEHS